VEVLDAERRAALAGVAPEHGELAAADAVEQVPDGADVLLDRHGREAHPEIPGAHGVARVEVVLEPIGDGAQRVARDVDHLDGLPAEGDLVAVGHETNLRDIPSHDLPDERAVLLVDVDRLDLGQAHEARQAGDVVEVVVGDGDLDRHVLVLQDVPLDELVQVSRAHPRVDHQGLVGSLDDVERAAHRRHGVVVGVDRKHRVFRIAAKGSSSARKAFAFPLIAIAAAKRPGFLRSIVQAPVSPVEKPTR
jgi:hypothetical protein